MFIRVLDLWLLVLWMIADNIIVFSRRTTSARQADRLSFLGIVLAGWAGISIAVAFGFAGVGGFGAFTTSVQILGLAVFVAGIAVRSTAIAQLGTFHMPVVAIRPEHRLVDTGLYRHVRHPSYLGACIAFLGFGLGLGSWLGALILLAMAMASYLYRIHVEERALLEALGDAYAAYQRRTHRLIPGVY